MLPQFLNFAGVGVLATTLQYAILVLSVETVGLSAVLGSSIGFVTSAAASYWLNYHFTFQSNKPHLTAASRFAVTAAVGLGINWALMTLLVHRTSASYIIAQVITSMAVLIWNFAVNSLWSFAGTGDPAPLSKRPR